MAPTLLPPEYPDQFAEWTRLMDAGEMSAADEYFFERMLPGLIPFMHARSAPIPEYDGLVSLMGFTPETTVITHALLRPKTLVVLHTRETAGKLHIVRKQTGIPAGEMFNEEFLHDDEHVDDVYLALNRALARFAAGSRIAVEITGGKKTMGIQIAIAVQQLKETFNMNIDLVYIDYGEYMPRYRKPKPDTTRLFVIPENKKALQSLFSFHAAPTVIASAPNNAKQPAAASEEMIVVPRFRTRGIAVSERSIFVLMPFSERWSNRVWEKIKSVCSGMGLTATRSDDLYGEEIIEDIWSSVCACRAVIADLTGKNPNVFYELGLAHTLGKRFILQTQRIDDVPFDLRSLRFILYSDDPDGFGVLEKNLTAMLKERAPL